MDPHDKLLYRFLQYENIPKSSSRPRMGAYRVLLVFQYCLICGYRKCTDEEWKDGFEPKFLITCEKDDCLALWRKYHDRIYKNSIYMDKL